MNWLRLSNNNSYLFIFLLYFSVNCTAQDVLQEYKKSYPDFNELVLNDSQVYSISMENNKLKIIQDNYFESLILSQNGIHSNQETFSYSKLMQLKSFDAYTVSSALGKGRKYKVTETNEKKAEESSVFSSDLMERNLIFPNLETGAKKIYEYQIEVTDPFLLHKFIFGSRLPIINSSIEITVDKDINIGYKVFNDPTNSIEFTKTEKRGNWVYKWALKNSPPVKYEPSSPGFLYTIPNINIFIKDYTYNNTKVDVLGDVGRLFNYYKRFTDKLNQTDDQTLKGITEDIIANKVTDVEKIKSIFYWVKDNIKYIAFESGYEGFIPREAGLVCERKFGDCKDMASIITAMAKFAKVPNVKIAWIGTRTIPYIYDELAIPGVTNHMIAVYKNDEEYIFLDGTDKETKYGIPSSFIQGKEALIEENGNPKVVLVPIVSNEINEINETVNLIIENNKLIGSGQIQFNGYSRSNTLMQIGDATAKTRFEMIKSCVTKGNNKFNLKEFEEQNIKDRDLPYKINFKFDLDNYLVKIEKEIYINLFLDKHYENLTLENDRSSKYDFDFLNLMNSQYEIEIPQNLVVNYLPKDFHLDDNLLKADFEFTNKNNKIRLNVKILHKKLLLDTSDFGQWNENIKKIKAAYLETIILTEK